MARVLGDVNIDHKGASVSEDTGLIFSQIEATAGYHTPGVYKNLLSYYDNLTLNSDGLAQEFIPLSTVPQRSRNLKIFAIGVIPPAINVEGLAKIARGELALDRSATVGAVEGAIVTFKDVDGNVIRFDTLGTQRVRSEADDTSAAANGGTRARSQGGSKSSAARDHPPEFWQAYVSMCNRLDLDPIELAAVIDNESGFDPGAANYSYGRDKPPVAVGMQQFTRQGSKAAKMPPEVFDSYLNLSAQEQLPWMEVYMRRTGMRNKKPRAELYRRNFGDYKNPDGSLYSRDAAAKGFKDPGAQKHAYDINKPLDFNKDGKIDLEDLQHKVRNKPAGFIRQRIEEAIAAGVDIPDPGTDLPQPDAENKRASSWEEVGSQASDKAKKFLARIADSGLNALDFGQNLTAAQQAQAKQIALALQNIRDTPPLRMLVNPRSFSVKSEKIVSDGNWGRNGPIIEFWGDNQDKLSGSGAVAGFYAIDRQLGHGPGLTRHARNFSQGYQNFQSLFLLYRNNAGLYLEDNSGPSTRLNLHMLGSIYIYYDEVLYIGSFDSLNVTEEDTKPFTMDYSFDFTVRAAFLLDRPDSTFTERGRQRLRAQDRMIPAGPAQNEPLGDSQAFQEARRLAAQVDEPVEGLLP